MRFSTIGTSWITELFIKASKEHGKASLLSVYSRTEEAAKEFATKHNANYWFTDIEEMLDDDSDFIYIASPNSLHYKHVLTCIQKGKHVFCEKPLSYTEKQVQQIKEEAEKNSVFVFEGYRHLYVPNYEILKENIKQVGRIRSVFMQYIQYSSKYDAFKEGKLPNVFTREFAGGALMDLGVYPLSMTIDLFGEPEDVRYFPVLLHSGVDGSGTLVVSYKDFNVTIMCSKVAQGMLPAEIHGEDGTLILDHVSPIREITFYNRQTKEELQLAGNQHELDMVYELEAFQSMITNHDIQQFNQWLNRSEVVAKWTEKVRRENGILYSGE